ncbi:hypothetical protein VTN00DRAFT_5367 [Thermoascus crustaceus]|uniref:uncharacterized protein n=1 Tax=Thermoascus crustaceus TaxID=5088 RepID=UPI003742D8DF
MAAKPRLTVASTWAFEEVGVQEICHHFKSESSRVDCEYHSGDDVFVIKGGNVEESITKFGQLVTDFIEDQRNKDLLEIPRIRRLEVSSTVDAEGVDSGEATPEKKQREQLVLLDDSSDEETPTSSNDQCTKYWLSPNGGLGCFAGTFHDVLSEIATLTGTQISIEDDVKGIQVSGSNATDVDDALEKLTQIEKPLSLVACPQVTNIIQASEENLVRFRIENYSSLNPVALPRILTDPNLSTNFRLCQMYVTVLEQFDPDTEVFTTPVNIENPPRATKEPGRSRIWTDFKFQEIGTAEDYAALLEGDIDKVTTAKSVSHQSEMGRHDAISEVASDFTAADHPYLTREKAEQVDQWVTEGVRKGAVGVQAEPNDEHPPEPVKETPVPVPVSVVETKKVPGVKIRKPVAVSQPLATASVQPPHLSSPVNAKDTFDPPADDHRSTVVSCDTNATKIATPLEPEVGQLIDTEQPTISNPRDVSWTPTRPKTPENQVIPASNSMFPSNFDSTRYGLNKTPKQTQRPQRNVPVVRNGDRSRSNTFNTRKGQGHLIDVFSPPKKVVPTSYTKHTLSFSQPALIPHAANDSLDSKSAAAMPDIAEIMDEKTSPSDSRTVRSSTNSRAGGFESATFEEEKMAECEERLSVLKQEFIQHEYVACEDDKYSTFSAASRPRSMAHHYLRNEKLAELEGYEKKKKEEKQTMDEVVTRKFYRTPSHKAGKQNAKTAKKAEMKAKRQATLEDAWGKMSVKPSKKPSKKPPTEPEAKPAAPELRGKQTLSLITPEQKAKGARKKEADLKMQESIKRLLEALEPVLDAAQYFPGALTLEMQIGLILTPLLPKTYKGGSIPLSEWNKIFQPRNSLSTPSTQFIKRLTSSGADIDYIVDLKSSKSTGKRRLFEQEYADYGVVYEYHCRTKNDKQIVMVIDETGNVTVRKLTPVLGAVNLHFPKQTWDASVVVTGVIEQVRGSDKELDSAIQHIMNNLWIPPDKSLIRIFTRIPKDSILQVEKVFMKRWTRHRYIRPDNTSNVPETADNTKLNPVTPKKQMTRAEESSDAGETDNDRQDIFLKITEVQELFTGTAASDPSALRARCLHPDEMAKKGRLWYEVSVVSPAIEDVLHSNVSLELGERTEDWCSSDLMGNEANLVTPNHPNTTTNHDNNNDNNDVKDSTISPVAAAIGKAGIGEMFRLLTTVVEKIDGIGFWNSGPGVEAAMNAMTVDALAAAAAAAGAAPTVGQITGPSTAVVPYEQKGKNFEEIQSVKDMDSASVRGRMILLDPTLNPEFW